MSEPPPEPAEPAEPAGAPAAAEEPAPETAPPAAPDEEKSAKPIESSRTSATASAEPAATTKPTTPAESGVPANADDDGNMDTPNTVETVQLTSEHRSGHDELQLSKSKGGMKKICLDELTEVEPPEAQADPRNEDSDSSSSDESFDNNAYFLQNELTLEEDFLAAFGDMPNIEDIVLEPSIASIVSIPADQREPSKASVLSKAGQFVDPLTGMVVDEDMRDPDATAAADATIQEDEDDDEEEQEEEEEEEAQDEESEDLLIADEYDDAAQEKKHDVFFQFDQPEIHEDEEFDFEDLQRAEAERQLQASTHKFVLHLVDAVVMRAEYIDPNVVLRANLDKMALSLKIENNLDELTVQQRMRAFLNRKVVQYFRRKKAFRSIMEDNPNSIVSDIRKYKESLNRLDELLGREREAQEQIDLRMKESTEEFDQLEEKTNTEIRELDDMIRKTFTRDSFDRLKMVIDNQLLKMGRLRTEICNVRVTLIGRQHTYGALMAKLEALESLGDGLNMRDYEHRQTETQALSKKIEERNMELQRFRSQCNKDIHNMAHLRENRIMMRHSMGLQEGALNELTEEKQDIRRHLYDLKVERGMIRSEIQELTFQGGLVAKPALMLDYDATVVKLNNAKAHVHQLQNRFREIQSKLERTLARCAGFDYDLI